MERFAPAHVVVNRDGDILHYSPRTGKYLEPAAGLPNRQLLAMARTGLRLDLRSALREAVETGRRSSGITSPSNSGIASDDRPHRRADRRGRRAPVFLVVFTDVGPSITSSEAARQPETEQATCIEQLERELRDTRERLQGTIEEYESSLEELKSSNEELQSVNEELQSTNEELETSKEEPQSVNEELQTVNAELNGKVDELDRSTAIYAMCSKARALRPCFSIATCASAPSHRRCRRSSI